jgi:hypothetical protein
MARELRLNGFLLPAFTAYNSFDIPFAYPPLGLYVLASLSGIGIPELVIVQWLPVLVSCLSVPAFFLLANAVLKDRPRAAVATMLFALMPGSYDWQIMGGGVTRAFGVLFFCLAVYSVYKLFESTSWKRLVLGTFFCSLAVLSHPEIIMASATGCALLWAYFGRTWKKSFTALLVAAGTLVLTAPWWGNVLARHGMAPFLSALNTGAYRGLPFAAIYEAFLAPHSLFTLFGLLQWAGMLWSLWKKQTFLVAWGLLPYFVEPRSASTIAALPAAMLMALSLTDVVPALMERIRTALKWPVRSQDFTRYPWLNTALLLLSLGLFITAALHDFSVANTTLKPPEPQDLMAWVANNTPPDSQFLILTGKTGVATDPIQEWFPALTARRSQTTSQGLEWTLGTGFFTRLNQLMALQGCGEVACLNHWSADTGLGYTAVVVERSNLTESLARSLSQDDTFQLIYQNPGYLLYRAPR